MDGFEVRVPKDVGYEGDTLHTLSGDIPTTRQGIQNSGVTRRPILAGLALLIAGSLLPDTSEAADKPKGKETISAELAQETKVIEDLLTVPEHPIYKHKEMTGEVIRPFMPPDKENPDNADMSKWTTVPIRLKYGEGISIPLQGVRFSEDTMIVESYSVVAKVSGAAEGMSKGVNFVAAPHRPSKVFERVPVFKKEQLFKGPIEGKDVIVTGYGIRRKDNTFTPLAAAGKVIELSKPALAPLKRVLIKQFAQLRAGGPGVTLEDIDPQTRSAIEKIVANSFFIKTRARDGVGDDLKDDLMPGALVTLIDPSANAMGDAKIAGMVYARILIPTGKVSPKYVEGYLAQKSDILSQVLDKKPN